MFIDSYNLAQDATFKNRFIIALCKAANDVSAEGMSAKNVVDFKRHTLATQVLSDGGVGKLTAFINAALAGSAWTLTSLPADTDLSNLIASVFNNIAGVSAADKA